MTGRSEEVASADALQIANAELRDALDVARAKAGDAIEERDALWTDLEATRIALADLLNQLALLTRDDVTYLWRIGGRPLDDAYKAAKRALSTMKANDK